MTDIQDIMELPDDDHLLKDGYVEGVYLTNKKDIIVDIVDPSINEPSPGFDWATNITVYQIYRDDNGKIMRKQDIDGYLKDNNDTSTWKEIIDIIFYSFGLKLIGQMNDELDDYYDAEEF